jgi:transposase
MSSKPCCQVSRPWSGLRHLRVVDGLHAAVIYRKLSLGSRSQGGERTIEWLLSVDQTCRLQRRSLYAYLADVLTATARGDPVPALS